MREGDLLARRGADKVWKYEALRRALVLAFLDHAGVVRDFIIGVRGSIPEDRWVFHMAALGVGKGDQRRIMTQITQESVEGSWQVLIAWREESGTDVGTEAGARSSRGHGSGPQSGSATQSRPRGSVGSGRTLHQ